MNILTYKGQIISQRDSDNYVNATQMCNANDKRVNDWTRTEDFHRYLAAISGLTGIPADVLVCTINTGNNSQRGTWIHPKLAIKLARWISVEFELWCDEHIKTLIESGYSSITSKQDDEREWLRFGSELAEQTMLRAGLRLESMPRLLQDTSPSEPIVRLSPQ